MLLPWIFWRMICTFLWSTFLSEKQSKYTNGEPSMEQILSEKLQIPSHRITAILNIMCSFSAHNLLEIRRYQHHSGCYGEKGPSCFAFTYQLSTHKCQVYFRGGQNEMWKNTLPLTSQEAEETFIKFIPVKVTFLTPLTTAPNWTNRGDELTWIYSYLHHTPGIFSGLLFFLGSSVKCQLWLFE